MQNLQEHNKNKMFNFKVSFNFKNFNFNLI